AWANDVAMAPVLESYMAFDEDQVLATGLAVDVDDPVHGTTRQVGPTFCLHDTPSAEVQGPQPALDQHREEVLGSLADRPRPAARGRPAKRPRRHPLEGCKGPAA